MNIILATMSLVLVYISSAKTLPVNGIVDTKSIHLKSGPADKSTSKDRYTRETSEYIAPAATTSEIPPTMLTNGDEEEEGSTANVQSEMMCNKCRSLREALTDYFVLPQEDLSYINLKASYNSFLLADLFYAGLLGGGELSSLPPSETTRKMSKQICNRVIKDIYRPQNVSSGHCSWHYECHQDLTRFPSFKVQAVIDNMSYEDRSRCHRETMTSTYFKKTECSEYNCGKDHWIPVEGDSITVGYRAALYN